MITFQFFGHTIKLYLTKFKKKEAHFNNKIFGLDTLTRLSVRSASILGYM